MDFTKREFFNKLKSLPFVETIWLFGSRARGDNMERADIDLAISCHEAGTKEWLIIAEIIEDADTLLEIDLVNFDKLPENSVLKQNILNQGIVLYEK